MDLLYDLTILSHYKDKKLGKQNMEKKKNPVIQ